MTVSRRCAAPGCRKALPGPVDWCPYCGAPQRPAAATPPPPVRPEEPPPPADERPQAPEPVPTPGPKPGPKPGQGRKPHVWLKAGILAAAVAGLGYGLHRGGLLPGLGPEPAARATLTILSVPPNGIVRIDGVERGRAPVTVEVEADRLVQVSVVGIGGYQPQNQTFSLSPGEPRTVTLRLTAKRGGL